MAWLSDFEYEEDEDIYWRRHKLSNGQFCMIIFERGCSDCGDVEDYNVAFAVANKKKQLKGYFNCSKDNTITLKSTGTCGLEALRWARDTIFEFEDAISKEYQGQHLTINIMLSGEDARRFRVYEKALSKFGYKKVPGRGNKDWPWYMKKTVLNKGIIENY